MVGPELLTRLTQWLLWQGEVFLVEQGELVNSISPIRVLTFKAKVYPGPSRFDGEESIIIDYSKTSWLARFVRDEIRQIDGKTYLGFAYLFRLRLVTFSLTAPAT